MASDASGDHLRRLTHPDEGVVDVDPKISPNGRRVAFERDDTEGISHLMVVGIHGRGLHEVDVCDDPCIGANQPTWGPDGHHLYFTRVDGPIDSDGNAVSARLWRTDLQGQHVVPVSDPNVDGRFEDAWAQFAPAGYIVFVRLSLARDDAAVFRMRPDGTHACRLTPWNLDADLPDVSPATSGPTQNRAVFETYGHGGPPRGKVSAIATVRASCGGEHHIRYVTSATSDPVWHFNPGWSPHGRHVVFVRFKAVDGDPIVHGDIMTSRWDGEHRQLISRSPLFDFRPDWGPAPRAS
jgi:Tol biopolymer transport system component